MTDEDKGQTDQKSFMQKHKNMTCYNYPGLPALWVRFPSGSSPIISFLYYTIFRHNRHCLPCSGEPFHPDLQFHIGKRCYQALQCFLGNYSYHLCCPYRHLTCMIRQIPHFLSIARFVDFRPLLLSQMAVSLTCYPRLFFYNVERNLFVRSNHCCSVTIK
jgi:hypothetical protein